MSLMRTLARVATAVAVAKGAQAVMRSSRKAAKPGEGLLDGFRNAGTERAADYRAAPTGMAEAQASYRGQTGGLGALVDQVFGGRINDARSGAAAGGLGGLLDGLLGGSGFAPERSGTPPETDSSTGRRDAGDLVDEPTRAGMGLPKTETAPEPQGSFGEVLNSQFDSTDEPPRAPTTGQEATAAILLKAMIQAMKADGRIDEAEQARLVERMGEIGAEERAFIERELRQPTDPAAFGRSIPKGLERQAYAVSVLAIDIDSPEEERHLATFAESMGLDRQAVDTIHDALGVARLQH